MCGGRQAELTVPPSVASPTIRKSGPAPEQRYRPHRKRATMPMPSLLLSATAVGQSRQRRTLAQHGPSGLRAVAGAASATPAAVAARPGSERRVGVEVALGQDAECRQSASKPLRGRKRRSDRAGTPKRLRPARSPVAAARLTRGGRRKVGRMPAVTSNRCGRYDGTTGR